MHETPASEIGKNHETSAYLHICPIPFAITHLISTFNVRRTQSLRRQRRLCPSQWQQPTCGENPMPLTPQLIDAAVERYWRERDRYQKLAECIGDACQRLLEEHSIRGSVQWRAKDPTRLRTKLEKYFATKEHAAEFTDVDSVFRVLKDLAGARITTCYDPDRARVIALVQTRFCGFGSGSQVGAEVKDQPSGFYRATHCMVRLKDEDAVLQYQNLKSLGCEVQVCSQLAQVYHDLEHDLRYKPFTGALSKKENDLLNALARLMEVGDTIINQTRDAVEARQRERHEELSQSQAALHPVESFRDNPFLKALADSPVLLKLAGQIQSSRPQHDLPETPAEFYQEMVRLLAAGALLDGDFNSVPPSDANALLESLPRIAWRLFDHDARYFSIFAEHPHRHHRARYRLFGG